MAYDQSLVLYQPSSPVTSPRSTSLTRVFNAQTGTAIATELLYRILMEILHRLFNTFQNFASNRLDQLSAYLETKAEERQARRLESVTAKVEENKAKSLGIVEQVAKLEEEKGQQWPACPLQQQKMGGGRMHGRPGPPEWVRDAMRRWRKEPMVEDKEYWIQSLGD